MRGDDQVPKVLILTSHFSTYTGSEIVALEVAEAFQARGYEVHLSAYVIGGEISTVSGRNGIVLINDINDIKIQEYEIVWSQHHLLSQIVAEGLLNGGDERWPLIISVFLSPYDTMERPNLIVTNHIADFVYANSPETAKALKFSGVSNDKIRVFHNAAPGSFWSDDREPQESVSRILIVSNHMLPELKKAILSLRYQKRLSVRRIGGKHGQARVTPPDIQWADAVVTVGKTVQYCIAAGVPVYLYGRQGGGGWLDAKEMPRALEYNFSGRPDCRRIGYKQIVRELTSDYREACATFARRFEHIDKQDLVLDGHIDALIERCRDHAFRAAQHVRMTKLRESALIRESIISASNFESIIRYGIEANTRLRKKRSNRRVKNPSRWLRWKS